MIVDWKFFYSLSYLLYAVVILLLIGVLFRGAMTGGATSWFELGSFKFQPSEFAKFATALAVARYLSLSSVDFKKLSTKLISISLFAIPAVLIALQPDMGSVLVYAAFVFVLYRAPFEASSRESPLTPVIMSLGSKPIALKSSAFLAGVTR